jgi:hypothetical protein
LLDVEQIPGAFWTFGVDPTGVSRDSFSERRGCGYQRGKGPYLPMKGGACAAWFEVNISIKRPRAASLRNGTSQMFDCTIRPNGNGIRVTNVAQPAFLAPEDGKLISLN